MKIQAINNTNSTQIGKKIIKTLILAGLILHRIRILHKKTQSLKSLKNHCRLLYQFLKKNSARYIKEYFNKNALCFALK